ncbi:MAG: helix-turn-helix transcriptional regulator [Oscillibacter sp.]|nr:helix-turn-helix transcriptional regulator [Oscillibacter sp.]
MTIGERIKAIRKGNSLTLDRFGERIGIKGPSVSMMERSISNPSKQTILSICREFGIREEWLRTGEGPMKEAEPSGDDLDACLDRWGLPREFRGLFIAYRNLKTDGEREAVCQFIRDAAAEIASEAADAQADETEEEQWEREAREEAEEYYQLRLAEKRAIEADVAARGLTGTGRSSSNSGHGGGVA